MDLDPCIWDLEHPNRSNFDPYMFQSEDADSEQLYLHNKYLHRFYQDK